MGAFVGGALQSLGWLGVGWAAVQLATRLWGSWLAPQVWWSALAAPVLIVGWWRMRSQRLTGPNAAAHLDRRLSLHGLLLCAHDGPLHDAAWQRTLDERLAALPAVLPRPRWRALLPLPMLALALAAGIALLPGPPLPASDTPLPALHAELEKIAAAMRDLFERGVVPDEVKQELQQKLAELQRKVDAGEVPEWRDLDQLDLRLEREQLLQVAVEKLPKNGAADGRLADVLSKALSPGKLAELAKTLAELGLLDKLPGDLLAALKKAQQGDGSFAAEALALDPAMLARLAEAFAGMANQLGPLEGLAGIDPALVAGLQQLLAQFGRQGSGAGQDENGDGPGRGGVSRGPGNAALSLTEHATGGADAAMVLPPGHGLPGDWVPVGSSRIEPVVAPERSTAGGGAGAVGAGGASWQLHLAPRHRAVLQRFFGTGDSSGVGKDKR